MGSKRWNLMAAEVDLCMEEDFVAAAEEKFGINDY